MSDVIIFGISYTFVAIFVTVYGIIIMDVIEFDIYLGRRKREDLRAPSLAVLLGWIWPVLFLMLVWYVIRSTARYFAWAARELRH